MKAIQVNIKEKPNFYTPDEQGVQLDVESLIDELQTAVTKVINKQPVIKKILEDYNEVIRENLEEYLTEEAFVSFEADGFIVLRFGFADNNFLKLDFSQALDEQIETWGLFGVDEEDHIAEIDAWLENFKSAIVKLEQLRPKDN